MRQTYAVLALCSQRQFPLVTFPMSHMVADDSAKTVIITTAIPKASILNCLITANPSAQEYSSVHQVPNYAA